MRVENLQGQLILCQNPVETDYVHAVPLFLGLVHQACCEIRFCQVRRRLPGAVLRCAELRCAVLCCAVLCILPCAGATACPLMCGSHVLRVKTLLLH